MRSEAIDVLIKHRIRPSEQRIAVMQYLITHRTHPSVDTIYEDLHPSMPTLSRTTVYNVLRSLVEKGAVLMLTIDDKNARFDADITPHSHFRCNSCGELFDLPQPVVGDLDAPGFRIDDIHIYYRGICPKCQKN